MGLFDIFRKKKKVKISKKRQRRSSTPKTKEDIVKLKSDIENLQSQILIIDIVLHKHDDDIAEHSILLEKRLNSIRKEYIKRALLEATGPHDMRCSPVLLRESVPEHRAHSMLLVPPLSSPYP